MTHFNLGVFAVGGLGHFGWVPGVAGVRELPCDVFETEWCIKERFQKVKLYKMECDEGIKESSGCSPCPPRTPPLKTQLPLDDSYGTPFGSEDSSSEGKEQDTSIINSFVPSHRRNLLPEFERCLETSMLNCPVRKPRMRTSGRKKPESGRNLSWEQNLSEYERY